MTRGCEARCGSTGEMRRLGKRHIFNLRNVKRDQRTSNDAGCAFSFVNKSQSLLYTGCRCCEAFRGVKKARACVSRSSEINKPPTGRKYLTL